MSGTAYSPANQFANSWASVYLKKQSAAELIGAGGGGTGQATYSRAEMPVYDYSYLANEAMWDSFYFSGASSSVQPGSGGGSPAVWNSTTANITRTHVKAIEEFIQSPSEGFLKNPRMRFHSGRANPAALKTNLVRPEGCLTLAAHLMVDGAFNINSTSEKAWTAFLCGMRGRNFDVRDGSPPAAGNTAFSRFRNPIGTDNNDWMGLRSLSDPEVEELAKKILPDEKAASGIRLFVLEDDAKDFAWGSTRFINATGRKVVFVYEKKRVDLPASWDPVQSEPGGDSRNMEVKFYFFDQPARAFYSGIWEQHPDLRMLVFLVPGVNPRLGPVAMKMMPEDRRLLNAAAEAAKAVDESRP